MMLKIRPMRGDERAYVVHSWAEEYKNSPKLDRLPWALFKQTVRPKLDEVLRRADTEVLVATQLEGSDAIVGWIAFARGSRVSTVHWIHTRFRIAPSSTKLRGQGVATQLFDAAKLGTRLAFTHRGPRVDERAEGVKPPWSDAVLTAALAKRGIGAAYVPYEEWKA